MIEGIRGVSYGLTAGVQEFDQDRGKSVLFHHISKFKVVKKENEKMRNIPLGSSQ